MKLTVLWLLIAISIVYWFAAGFFKPRHVIEFVDGILITCSLAVLIVYGKQFWKGLNERRPDILSVVIIGIAGGWMTNGLDRVWRLIARVTGNAFMMEHHVIGYMLVLLSLFACMHLIVRKAVMQNGGTDTLRMKVSSEAKGSIIVALIAGVALGAASVWIDIAVFEEWR